MPRIIWLFVKPQCAVRGGGSWGMLQLALFFHRYSLWYGPFAAPQGIKQQCSLGSDVPLAPRTIGVCKGTDRNPEILRTVCSLDIGCRWVQQELHIQDMGHIHLPHATVTEFLRCSCIASLWMGVRCKESSHLTWSEDAEGPAFPTCGRYCSKAAGDVPHPPEVRSSSSAAQLPWVAWMEEQSTKLLTGKSQGCLLYWTEAWGMFIFSLLSASSTSWWVLPSHLLSLLILQIIFFCLLKGYLSFVF